MHKLTCDRTLSRLFVAPSLFLQNFQTSVSSSLCESLCRAQATLPASGNAGNGSTSKQESWCAIMEEAWPGFDDDPPKHFAIQVTETEEGRSARE